MPHPDVEHMLALAKEKTGLWQKKRWINKKQVLDVK